MKYEMFMHITPPTATVQHKGERVIFDKKTRRHVVVHYMKTAQRKALDNYCTLLRHDIVTRGDGIGVDFMFTKQLVVEIDFMFPHGTSVVKRDRDKTFARITRPDLDNMAKGLLDCLMEVGLIQDDAQIFDLHLRKFNTKSKNQGIRIYISDEPCYELNYRDVQDKEKDAN